MQMNAKGEENVAIFLSDVDNSWSIIALFGMSWRSRVRGGPPRIGIFR
jgi:hypothetical protein